MFDNYYNYSCQIKEFIADTFVNGLTAVLVEVRWVESLF